MHIALLSKPKGNEYFSATFTATEKLPYSMMGMMDGADLHNAVVNAPIGICILDAATLISKIVNDKFLEVAGRPYETIYNRFYWDAFPETRSGYEAALQGVVDNGEPYNADEIELVLIRHGKAEKVTVTFTFMPLKNQQGTVTKVAIWVLENTSRLAQAANEKLAAANEELNASNQALLDTKQSLQQLNDELEERVSERTRELQASEARFRLLMEKAPVAMNIFETRSMVVTFANDRMLELWDRKPEDLNRPFISIFPELAKQSFLHILDDVFTSGETYYGNENKAFILRDGQEEERYFNLIYQPVKDTHGNVKYIIQVLTEVTEEVTARQKLQQARQLLEAAVEAADIGTFIVNQTENTLTASAKMKEIFGYPPEEELLFDASVERVTDNYRAKMIKSFTASFVEGKPFSEEYTINRYNDNAVRWLRGVGKRDNNSVENQTFFLGALIDITEQVNAGQAEQQMNEELSAINEELMATNEELLKTQHQFIKIQNSLQKKGEDLEFAINAATLATFDLSPVTGRFSGNHLLKAWFGLKPDDEIDIQTGIDVVVEEDRQRVTNLFLEALQYDKGGNYDAEYTITNPSNPTPRVLRAKGKTKFDENNQPILLTGIVQDITEQKQDEQRKNDFISMVSHELKTPLTSMSGYLQILQAKARKTNDVLAGSMLEKAAKQAKRMGTLINGFLNTARLESGKLQIDNQRFDMALLMKEVEEEARAIISNHKIIFEPVEETYVMADWDKIGQVVNNFISNASKYSPMGTTIQVACVTKNNMAIVTVKDEGMGVALQDKDKIFDRFYRVQGATMGSIAGFGIGLYLCSEIILRHGGDIGVDSELGKGSTFYFTLPIME